MTFTALEDIVTPDGTVTLKAGELAATLTTGSDGTATSGTRCIWAAIRFWSAPRRMAW